MMFRNTLAIILLVAFASQTLQRTFIVLDYYTNAGSFARNCENKAYPQMHCNGKCVLMKKLKEQENKDQQNQERKQENKSEVVSSKSFFATLIVSLSEINAVKYFNSDNETVISMPRSFFHPPSI